MGAPEIHAILDRQLLLQLGDRLRRLRLAQGLGTVEMAVRVGVTRNTLRAVETGDPATSIGTYLRVMSVLGVSGELALLAGDALHPPPAGSAAARSLRAAPAVQVMVTVDDSQHRLQDLQSLMLHEEAVRRLKADPALVAQARSLVQRWLDSGSARSAGLWREWAQILDSGAWRKALGRGQRGQQLRQASPITPLLPEAVRQDILDQVRALRAGVVMGGPPEQAPASPGPGRLP